MRAHASRSNILSTRKLFRVLLYWGTFPFPPMHNHVRFTLFVCSAALALGLVACSSPQTTSTLPLGPQTLSGFVKVAELSLTRRGTDLLLRDGAPVCYLESSTVNLRSFEGRSVVLSGTVEPNTDAKDLPVLVVQTVVAGAGTGTRTWTIESLKLSIDTPLEWRGKVAGVGAQFTSSGASAPILTLFTEGQDHLLSSASSAPRGMTFTSFGLGIHRAVELFNAETGSAKVQVDLRPTITDSGANILTLLFTPSGEEVQIDPDAWRVTVDDVVHSLSFSGEGASSSVSFPPTSSSASSVTEAPLPLTGSGVGMPCGGTAGILCPTGMFCEITDVQANTGQCRKF